MKNICKKLLSSVLNIFGLEIRKVDKQRSRMSIQGGLFHIKKLGFYPVTVIDVGAAFGGWSRLCYQIFPKAEYILSEPLKEYQKVLKKYTNSHKNIKYFQSAVGSKNGYVYINVHKDLVGSSILKETDSSFSDGQSRKVPLVTLDKAVKRFKGPYLIKIDVQGAELEVLLGAKEILELTEYIILEVSLFESMKGSPQLFDIVNFMKKRGFVVYDIVSALHRPLDNALSQIDMIFVKEKGQFRKDHRYCIPEQRKKQNKEFVKKNQKKFKNYLK